MIARLTDVVTKKRHRRTEYSMSGQEEHAPRRGGFRSFHTARRTIQGFEAML